jgi:hypothetical protein
VLSEICWRRREMARKERRRRLSGSLARPVEHRVDERPV